LHERKRLQMRVIFYLETAKELTNSGI